MKKWLPLLRTLIVQMQHCMSDRQQEELSDLIEYIKSGRYKEESRL